MLDITTPIQYVKGVGPRKAAALEKMGITTVYDLLLYLPFRYEDRSLRAKVAEIEPGQEATVDVEVVSLRVRKTRRANFKVVELLAKDETGQLKAVWFNQEYLKDTLLPGKQVLLFGKFERTGFGLLPEVRARTTSSWKRVKRRRLMPDALCPSTNVLVRSAPKF